MGRYETTDMEWTESDARDNDRYKAWSDEELIDNEHLKGRDEIIDPDGRKKDHSRTREKEKHRTKDKEAESERFREHDRERDREHNSGKDKEKLKDRDRHKDRGRERDKEREREQDRDAVRDRDEDKEKLKGKDRERAKARESGREKEKDVLLKERDREKGKEKHKSKSKEKDRDEDKGVERKKQQEDNYDAEKQKERTKDRVKDAEIDRDLEYAKERKEEREKDKEREREREKKDRDKLREKDRERERDREREKDRDKERMRDKERDKVRHKDNERIRDRDHDRESDRDKEREREKERLKTKDRESKDAGKIRKEVRDYDDVAKDKEKSNGRDHDENDQTELEGSRMSAVSLEERLTKVRDERLKGKTDPGNEIAAWVSKSRKLDEQKNVEREKAVRFAKILEEQDGVEDTESDDEEKAGHGGKDLAGLKVLHGLDKVMEGGAVVLTLKDQNILAGGDVNDEIDMLENIEIGEQISRNEAYKAAKKKPGIYEDKFQNDTNTAKSILPQYDDPFKEEGITLDEMGGVSEEAQKKLEEIRKKLQGGYMENRVEDSLYQPGSSMSDYYTHDEMLQFKKPKKKKKLRKKDKLDVDALEADAIAAGLGVGDLGSRANINRRVSREEAEKMEAEQRKNAYEAAYNKAAEASRGLRDEKLSDAMQVDEDGDVVYGGDDEELYKSLEKARRAALKKQAEISGSGPQAVARLAVAANHSTGEAQNQLSDTQENKVIFTEMEEFVWSLQLDEDTQKPIVEDVFNEEDEGPGPVKQQDAAETIGGWTEVKELDTSQLKAEEEEEVVPDETIKEVSIGKGLASALQLLKERGTLKETVDWGGRNMDKKKSKLVGVRDNDGPKEILLDRLDEFGRVMTPKEAFRKLSHKFHGKGPGKMKQEKRMKQYQEELKLKQMNTGDTPLMSMEKMRDVQAKLRTPYIVLSGQIKPGQTSDPRSGFATVEKEPPGSLTPMLGDRKVEHFLGIKRKPEVGTMGPPKKPKS